MFRIWTTALRPQMTSGGGHGLSTLEVIPLGREAEGKEEIIPRRFLNPDLQANTEMQLSDPHSRRDSFSFLQRIRNELLEASLLFFSGNILLNHPV